jgi:hypothetical protein
VTTYFAVARHDAQHRVQNDTSAAHQVDQRGGLSRSCARTMTLRGQSPLTGAFDHQHDRTIRDHRRSASGFAAVESVGPYFATTTNAMRTDQAPCSVRPAL